MSPLLELRAGEQRRPKGGCQGVKFLASIVVRLIAEGGKDRRWDEGNCLDEHVRRSIDLLHLARMIVNARGVGLHREAISAGHQLDHGNADGK
jgi:hypothetical protein